MNDMEWRRLPRKEQELVLAVWENVLEKIKFRAAGPADFGTSYFDDIIKPKDTPFDAALNALISLAGGTPLYKHPCPKCVFLGSYKSGAPTEKMPSALSLVSLDPPEPKLKTHNYDMYYCNPALNEYMVTARFEEVPKGEEDCGYIHADITKKIDIPILRIAETRAIELGFGREDQ